MEKSVFTKFFNKVSVCLITFTLCNSLFAIGVDEAEIKSTSNQTITFENYTGPHSRVDTLEQIKGIGRDLANDFDKNIAKTYGGQRYSVIHAVDSKAMNRLLKKDLIKFLNNARNEGKIRHIGFSYHGPKEEFELLVDGYDWDVVMVQYNYFDDNVQASTEGIEYAASKGMGIFVMEPLKGGILAGKMPGEAEEIFRKANPNKSNAEWALEWVLNNRNVTTVFSGMNSMDQLDENLKEGDFRPLTQEEIDYLKGLTNV